MDQAKKQKVVLGVVVAALLGMGSYWAATRNSGSAQNAVVKQTGERKLREQATGDKKKGKARGKRKRAKKEQRTAERTTREVKERKTTERKRRKLGTKKKKKKRTGGPAA